MTAYYNEFDPQAAAWLRELIKAGHIADGTVDERSIIDVQAADLVGFTQCHFFAGIGGWSAALRLAGWPDDRPVWTGSPPCQPFSLAGLGKGVEDERHLAPHFLELVKAGRPVALFGEQVAAAVKKDNWLDDLLDELENQNYATGAAVLPACSVGAPQIRARIWFAAGWMGDGIDKGLEGLAGHGDRGSEPGRQQAEQAGSITEAGSNGWHDQDNGFWSSVDWLGCRDGKYRPVEPGTFPLANGIPARVGRLRGYGNAISPQAGAEVIKAFMSELDAGN